MVWILQWNQQVSKQNSEAFGTWEQMPLKFRTICGFIEFPNKDIFRLIVTKDNKEVAMVGSSTEWSMFCQGYKDETVTIRIEVGNCNCDDDEDVDRRSSIGRYVTSTITASAATIGTESLGKNKSDTLIPIPLTGSSNAQYTSIEVKGKLKQPETELFQVLENDGQQQKGTIIPALFHNNYKTSSITTTTLSVGEDTKKAEVPQEVSLPSKQDKKTRPSYHFRNKSNSSTSNGSALNLISNSGIMHAPSDKAYQQQQNSARGDEVETKKREYPTMYATKIEKIFGHANKL